jgi:hypothetical protein
MKALPAEVQFHEDVRLFVWRPRGLLDDAALNKVLGKDQTNAADCRLSFRCVPFVDQPKQIKTNKTGNQTYEHR